MTSQPPEEPHLRSELTVLSPTSPKPIHFPAPTNIPVLEMQTDVDFNQTEAHMMDPAMHDTELRPDAWRDPNDLEIPADNVSPYSAGGQAVQLEGTGSDAPERITEEVIEAVAENASLSNTNNAGDAAEEAPIPIPISYASATIDTAEFPSDVVEASSEPSVPAASSAIPTSQSFPSQADYISLTDQDTATQISGANADTQSLLDSLQTTTAFRSDTLPDLNTDPQADANPDANVSSDMPSAQAAPEQSDVGLLLDESALEPSSPAVGLNVAPSGLPPRPPPQEQPLIHHNYVHSQHIRDYHPHAANPAFQPHVRSGSSGNIADPASKNYVPPVHSPAGGSVGPAPAHPPNNAIAGGSNEANSPQATISNGAAYPSLSGQSLDLAASLQTSYNTQYQPQTEMPMDGQRELTPRNPEDRPWDAEVQRKYDHFIEEERKYVSEGRWEQFPQGSRLFVGNLSSEKVTKRDIFHVFHTYGDLAQISIKQAYGFVQFLRTEDCVRALDREQGTQIRDKKIHLEVSKPQKNRNQNNAQRRSRSPQDNGRGRPGGNVDRYVSGQRGGGNNNRSNYRSPSPRGGYRDRYDDRYRRRSPSPAYNRGGRYRSPSPRRDMDDDLPLPRRAPRDVPDVQMIVLDSLDREFISWLEQAFTSRGVRVDVLLLSPRLSEQAVVKRQIVEGVVAVVKLTRRNQDTGKIGLQIFDRRQGANNVKFEEYEGLDPPTAVELVKRAKQMSSAPPSGGYGGPQYGQQAPPPMPPAQSYRGYGAPPAAPNPYGQPPAPSAYQPSYGQPPAQAPISMPAGVPPHLQHMLTNLDPNNLQNLLSAMSTPQSTNSANPYANPSHPNSAAVAALQSNPALAGYLQQQHHQQQQQMQQPPSAQSGAGAVNMQDILARLGTHQR